MADLLRIRARNGDGIKWEFVDKDKASCIVQLDQPPPENAVIQDGDIWHVEYVNEHTDPAGSGKTAGRKKKTIVVRLIAKLQSVQPWENLTSLPDFWINPIKLRILLALLHEGSNIVLIGPASVGKTTLPYVIAEALHWQEPCKVDVGMIKRSSDLLGSDTAREGSTDFVRSELFEYVDRARVAHQKNLDAQFIVILDEINRVHDKSNQGLHGLFDDTRQLTIVSTSGPVTMTLPPNLHTIGTMNDGANYSGTFTLERAVKSRFAPLRIRAMPLDYEVKKLASEVCIDERSALAIVELARVLRGAEDAGQLSFSPDYRLCRDVARTLKHSIDLRDACIELFLGHYQGDLELDDKGRPKNPNSEIAKAFSALRMRGVVTKDMQGKIADIFKGGTA